MIDSLYLLLKGMGLLGSSLVPTKVRAIHQLHLNFISFACNLHMNLKKISLGNGRRGSFPNFPSSHPVARERGCLHSASRESKLSFLPIGGWWWCSRGYQFHHQNFAFARRIYSSNFFWWTSLFYMLQTEQRNIHILFKDDWRNYV